MGLAQKHKHKIYMVILMLVELFLMAELALGLFRGKIDVIFGHTVYGKASFSAHPLWYIFGVLEWTTICGILGFSIWRTWKRRA
ncbi:hypothetical protein [Acidithiobacillus thiooxidans]|uniref:hypothetical protein n=1 Tax=Acidithiobacillus thiooxidans TaxID=930 RepID=UPI001C06AA95|nr:hypothetical protein [Acidithiobacillus thiooxidans]MBU2844115.1 hypothetical protein [Acidithiobacillus thiooxidans]